MAELAPALPRASDLGVLSPDAELMLQELGPDALAWAAEVGERLVVAIEHGAPELGGNPAHTRLLGRGTTSSVIRAAHVVRGEKLDFITDEAVDVARDWARRGLELPTLLRNIRVGTATMAGAFLEAAGRLLADAERAPEMRRLSELFFHYVDDFSRQMSEAFQAERLRWTATEAAAQLELVNDLVQGRVVDPREGHRVLHYDIARRHACAVVWTDAVELDRTDQLRAAAVDCLRAMGAVDFLVVPVGLGATWAWGAVEGSGATGPPAPAPGIYTATSQVHAGERGFVRSHHEARAVERLMRLAPVSVRATALRHADVELPTLLCHDLDDARYFVQRHLGRLAVDDRRTREVRDTLRLYLDNERSVATVATQQYISRNTVTYRIKQAEQLSGRRLDRDRLTVHAALLLADLLGPRVLVTAPPS